MSWWEEEEKRLTRNEYREPKEDIPFPESCLTLAQLASRVLVGRYEKQPNKYDPATGRLLQRKAPVV